MKILRNAAPADIGHPKSAIRKRRLSLLCEGCPELQQLMQARKSNNQGKSDADVLTVRVTYTVTTDWHILIEVVELQLDKEREGWTLLWSKDHNHQGEQKHGNFVFYYLSDPQFLMPVISKTERRSSISRLAKAGPNALPEDPVLGEGDDDSDENIWGDEVPHELMPLHVSGSDDGGPVDLDAIMRGGRHG